MTAVYRQLTLVVLVLALALSGCNAISNDEAPAGTGEEVAQATEAPEPTEVAIGPPPAFREELQGDRPGDGCAGRGPSPGGRTFRFLVIGLRTLCACGSQARNRLLGTG